MPDAPLESARRDRDEVRAVAVADEVDLASRRFRRELCGEVLDGGGVLSEASWAWLPRARCGRRCATETEVLLDPDGDPVQNV